MLYSTDPAIGIYVVVSVSVDLHIPVTAPLRSGVMAASVTFLLAIPSVVVYGFGSGRSIGGVTTPRRFVVSSIVTISRVAISVPSQATLSGSTAIREVSVTISALTGDDLVEQVRLIVAISVANIAVAVGSVSGTDTLTYAIVGCRLVPFASYPSVPSGHDVTYITSVMVVYGGIVYDAVFVSGVARRFHLRGVPVSIHSRSGFAPSGAVRGART